MNDIFSDVKEQRSYGSSRMFYALGGLIVNRDEDEVDKTSRMPKQPV